MESFGTSGVPIKPAFDSPYLAGQTGSGLSIPRTVTVTAKLGQTILFPSSFFHQVEIMRHFVSRVRLMPVTPTKSEREERKARATFVQSVITNKAEGAKEKGR